MNTEVDLLRSQHLQDQSRLANLEASVMELQKTNRVLAERMEDMQVSEDASLLRKMIPELNQRIKDMRRAHDSQQEIAAREIQNLTVSLMEERGKVEELDREMLDYARQLDEMRRVISSKDMETIKLKAEHTARLNDAVAARNDAQLQLSLLEKSVGVQKDSAQSMQTRIHELENKLSDYEQMERDFNSIKQQIENIVEAQRAETGSVSDSSDASPGVSPKSPFSMQNRHASLKSLKSLVIGESAESKRSQESILDLLERRNSTKGSLRADSFRSTEAQRSVGAGPEEVSGGWNNYGIASDLSFANATQLEDGAAVSSDTQRLILDVRHLQRVADLCKQRLEAEQAKVKARDERIRSLLNATAMPSPAEISERNTCVRQMENAMDSLKMELAEARTDVAIERKSVAQLLKVVVEQKTEIDRLRSTPVSLRSSVPSADYSPEMLLSAAARQEKTARNAAMVLATATVSPPPQPTSPSNRRAGWRGSGMRTTNAAGRSSGKPVQFRRSRSRSLFVPGQKGSLVNTLPVSRNSSGTASDGRGGGRLSPNTTQPRESVGSRTSSSRRNSSQRPDSWRTGEQTLSSRSYGKQRMHSVGNVGSGRSDGGKLFAGGETSGGEEAQRRMRILQYRNGPKAPARGSLPMVGSNAIDQSMALLRS